MFVRIYTRPKCQPCRMTKARFKKAGIEVVEVPITDDIATAMKTAGYLSAPLVQVVKPLRELDTDVHHIDPVTHFFGLALDKTDGNYILMESHLMRWAGFSEKNIDLAIKTIKNL